MMGSVRIRPGWGVGQRSMSLQAVNQSHKQQSEFVWLSIRPQTQEAKTIKSQQHFGSCRDIRTLHVPSNTLTDRTRLTGLQTRLLFLKVLWSHDLQQRVEEGHIGQLTDQDQRLTETQNLYGEGQKYRNHVNDSSESHLHFATR